LTSELAVYINPYTNDEITDEELDNFCLKNKLVLTKKELHEIYQENLVQDKNFLIEVAIDNYDVDAARIIEIKKLCTKEEDFNAAEYLAKREKLVEKNLERVSRSGASKWKCTDCKVTADVFFMYQHECSESRVKKKKEKTKVEAKAKDKSSVKQTTTTVFWAGNERSKDTPPSDNGYSGPAWLTQTYPNNNNNGRGFSQSSPGGASKI
jgi:hypothetical protein